jgi:hypothetical protein
VFTKGKVTSCVHEGEGCDRRYSRRRRMTAGVHEGGEDSLPPQHCRHFFNQFALSVLGICKKWILLVAATSYLPFVNTCGHPPPS